MTFEAQIKKFTQDVIKTFSPPKIIMFGSHAYGKVSPDSDVDFLVIMPFQGKACRKTIEILNRADPRFPIDLLVRTPEQIKSRLEMGDFFIQEIVEKGKVLYEASHG